MTRIDQSWLKCVKRRLTLTRSTGYHIVASCLHQLSISNMVELGRFYRVKSVWKFNCRCERLREWIFFIDVSSDAENYKLSVHVKIMQVKPNFLVINRAQRISLGITYAKKTTFPPQFWSILVCTLKGDIDPAKK